MLCAVAFCTCACIKFKSNGTLATVIKWRAAMSSPIFYSIPEEFFDLNALEATYSTPSLLTFNFAAIMEGSAEFYEL